MGGNKVRDGILIGVVVLMAVLILWPSGEDESETEKNPETPTPDSAAGADTGGEVVSAAEGKPRTITLSRGAAPLSVPHVYFPLAEGVKWVYRVLGPEQFVKHDTWTMEVISIPSEEAPGVVKVGFGEDFKEAHVWLDGQSLRFDGLPFMEPVEFLGNRPIELSGAMLPAPVQMNPDAVWTMDAVRDVVYQYRDKKGKPHSLPAKANERARARAVESETIVTPGGPFKAWKISWISRIEIFAGKRPVLLELTAEPYRKETMWVAPGTGLVRRQIDYSNYRGADISFDLMEFSHPEKEE